MLLDLPYCGFRFVLPRQVRLFICWDESNISEESLNISLLEFIMIILVQCRWEPNKFNESPKGMPILCRSFILAWEEFLESKFVIIQSFSYRLYH